MLVLSVFLPMRVFCGRGFDESFIVGLGCIIVYYCMLCLSNISDPIPIKYDAFQSKTHSEIAIYPTT